MNEIQTDPGYQGFEQGPIRPPSESESLLLRLTRNCSWNRCNFCSVYKRAQFSLRPQEHVLADIDAVHLQLQRVRQLSDGSGEPDYREISKLADGLSDSDQRALMAASSWFSGGMRSIFLQDGNSLVLKPEKLVTILEHIRLRFPSVERITSYARSQTIDKISAPDLERIAAAGLNRIHIGLESGANRVLLLMKKGCDQAQHIRAGLKVKQAGMELSEYVMPGLGGRELSHEHALETAEALNQINPDFIRLRSLAIPNHTELFNQWQSGEFVKLGDREVAQEILLFIETLNGISSTLKSDHILNLFQEIEGTFPQDKPAMLGVIQRFQKLPAAEQVIYQVGRRMGLFVRLDDLERPDCRARAVDACQRFNITPENVDLVIEELMKRFI
ncbi:radical SAM protein [Geopsychrobacter electrodiphilus]|uniref:radical SAM protein n=1 Tax=Geopsychrobacter electrodiphilus TaxID=225196 RepID=UPI00036E13A4|nr:radical SAM protein [Geopsychrobacter electrodiphilus]